MILHVVAIRDEAVGSFSTPFFTRSTGEAVRGFSDAVNNPDTPYNKHAKDFSLWLLATFDDNGGSFDVPDTPTLLILGMNLLPK